MSRAGNPGPGSGAWRAAARRSGSGARQTHVPRRGCAEITGHFFRFPSYPPHPYRFEIVIIQCGLMVNCKCTLRFDTDFNGEQHCIDRSFVANVAISRMSRTSCTVPRHKCVAAVV